MLVNATYAADMLGCYWFSYDDVGLVIFHYYIEIDIDGSAIMLCILRMKSPHYHCVFVEV